MFLVWKLCKILNAILNVLTCIVEDIFICNASTDESENGHYHYEIATSPSRSTCLWREIGHYINPEGLFMDYSSYHN